MPLPNPTLDNRRFDQLVAEGRALIPRLASTWTDQNPSDPGITILELGAWMAEQNIYRFDRTSDHAWRSFVRLLGIEPRMPGVAATVVSVLNGNAAGVPLPARVQLAVTTVPLFETTDAVFASTAVLQTVLTARRPPSNRVADWTQAHDALTGFPAFGPSPRPGDALYLGFDRPLDAPGAELSLHVWTAAWRADAETRAALEGDFADTVARRPTHCPPPPDWRRHYRVATVWEFYAGAQGWRRLDVTLDDTRALTLTGFVRFRAPAGHHMGALGGAAATQFFVRCRIVRGRFECPPRLSRIGFNAVRCEHAVSVAEKSLGTSHGHARAIFSCGAAPVVSGSLAIRLDDGAGSVQTDWSEGPDFDRAGAHDRVLALNPEDGELETGNGLWGAIPPAGYQLLASFRVGGDVGGNLEAGRLTQIALTPHNAALVPLLGTLVPRLNIDQQFAALGGTSRERLESAQARAFEAATAVEKAVTLEDIETMALKTPGVPVARVRAVANLEPALPCYPAAGVTTVIVIPPCPRPAPLPSQAMLDAIQAYLEPRRLVTSEIRVMGPRYRRVAVRATLHVECDANAQAVAEQAEARVRAFLDPLDGGPAKRGWPFGRPVYRSEVMALVAGTPGVARVTALTLLSGCAGDCDTGRCDNIELCAYELVTSGRHQFAVETEAAWNLRRSREHECQRD